MIKIPYEAFSLNDVVLEQDLISTKPLFKVASDERVRNKLMTSTKARYINNPFCVHFDASLTLVQVQIVARGIVSMSPFNFLRRQKCYSTNNTVVAMVTYLFT